MRCGCRICEKLFAGLLLSVLLPDNGIFYVAFVLFEAVVLSLGLLFLSVALRRGAHLYLHVTMIPISFLF